MAEEKEKAVDPATALALITIGINTIERAVPYFKGGAPIPLYKLKASLADLEAMSALPEYEPSVVEDVKSRIKELINGLTK
jgi:hypothetical protein